MAATAVRLLALGPVLIFAGQAQWVPSMARAVILAMGPDAEPHEWPDVQWKIFESVCIEELGLDAPELEAARLGVICHSGTLPNQVRIAIETLMAVRAPRIIVATTTLGQGVNIGISSVIIATTWIGKTQITKRDFWNICGRAGRAFVDSEGKVLFAIDATKKTGTVRRDEEIAKQYFDIARLDEVQSGLLQIVKKLHSIALLSPISFETLLEACANDNFDRMGEQKEDVLQLVDLLDDNLLALHAVYLPEDGTEAIDWVDDAFRDSLASIQERAAGNATNESTVLAFLRARATGVLVKVPVNARNAVVASGLPVSVGVQAFAHLDAFRDMTDRYLAAGKSIESLYILISGVEQWARQHAVAIVENMPAPEALDQIRPQWLSGVSLRTIIEVCGDQAKEICANYYGYELSWLFHSVAQNLDKVLEEDRFNVLTTVSLLLELGLPTEPAAKVFLAGVRSRTVAVELGEFMTDPKMSVSEIRKMLLDREMQKEYGNSISQASLEWLRLLSIEHSEVPPDLPRFEAFKPDTPPPAEVRTLHARMCENEETVVLCSADARYKVKIRSTDQRPFNVYANDHQHVFVRDGEHWIYKSRYPSEQSASESED